MLARRLPTILPPLTRAEAIEVTRIHSVVGVHAGGLITSRPFRAPHHTISAAGLAGGSTPPRPGEATLAHRGVLFLDELSEFQRSSLDALRQPLEDGRVTIVRGQQSLTFPTSFMLVAATNPCPCGFAGVDDRCTCGEADLRRHRRRLSGPLLDRMDLLVDVRRPEAEDLSAAPLRSSADVLARVTEARDRQRRRLSETGVACNGEMDARTADAVVRLDGWAAEELGHAYKYGWLSARGRHRVLRVAQTIADLGRRETVSRDDILLALSLRQRTGTDRADAA
jgi:magnesium chelatase family protein